MDDSRLKLQLEPTQLLQEELSHSIIPAVRDHWQKKISEGIVLTEVLSKGPVDWVRHAEETAKLADFEVDVFGRLLMNEAMPKLSDPVKELHYFGIGTGEALLKVAILANCFHYEVVAYDTCPLGCENGQRVLKSWRTDINNRALLADIFFACRRKYIDSERADKLVISRVLQVLDKQEPNWQKKPRRLRKMACTARRIGKELLPFLEVMLIHPCSEDNPHVVHGDSTPSSIEEIRRYMSEGLKSEVFATRLGKVSYYNHVYTAVVMMGKKV